MERTVEIHIDFERITKPTMKDVESAVGYFVLWSTYTVCKIYNDGNDDLIAVYFDGDVRKYVIGAVWRGTEYSYHS